VTQFRKIKLRRLLHPEKEVIILFADMPDEETYTSLYVIDGREYRTTTPFQPPSKRDRYENDRRFLRQFDLNFDLTSGKTIVEDKEGEKVL